jgi:hypothetical protein
MNEINIEKFKNYLNNVFGSQITYYEIFNAFHYFQIDCFPSDSKHRLAIEISKENIKFSTVTKEPSIDFSLYDYVIDTNTEAEKFIVQIQQSGFPKDFG